MFAGVGAVWSGIPAWAFWAAALLCFFYTSFRVWQKEHRKVAELTEEPKITFAVHGIPRPWQSGQRQFLIVPEVTVANHSHGQAIAVDAELDMLGAGGFQAACLPENQGVETWEQSLEQSGLHVLVFPARLEPRGVAKGYIAFRSPPGLGQTNFTPLRSQTNGVRCRIQFTDCHLRQVIHEEEIEFHGI